MAETLRLLIICRHGDSFGWNHWRPASAAFIRAMIALPEPVLGRAYGPTHGPTRATSIALLWPISSGSVSSWMIRTPFVIVAT
jgi:hypothetical protein